jgi:hypothetical protein
VLNQDVHGRGLYHGTTWRSLVTVTHLALLYWTKLFKHWKNKYKNMFSGLSTMIQTADTKLNSKILNYPYLKPGEWEQLPWKPSNLLYAQGIKSSLFYKKVVKWDIFLTSLGIVFHNIAASYLNYFLSHFVVLGLGISAVFIYLKLYILFLIVTRSCKTVNF